MSLYARVMRDFLGAMFWVWVALIVAADDARGQEAAFVVASTLGAVRSFLVNADRPADDR